MNLESFQKQIEKELKLIAIEQVVDFAWFCAIRTLPYLGSNSNFNFWKKTERQCHIYTMFYALDFNTSDPISTGKAAADAYAAASAISGISDGKASLVSTNAALTVAYAVDAFNALIDNNINAAVTFATAAARDAIAAAYANDKINNELKAILLEDLKNIQNNEKGHSVHIELYGEVWDNFQNALEKEDCSYWGRLYKNIFNDELSFSKKNFNWRTSVPKEIEEQGAAKVANYLEELENEGAERLNEARIIILGDKGGGKTCLARRLIDSYAPMTTDNESTAGVDTTLWKLSEENINIRIWDFAGHTITHAVHQFFLSERCLYIIVYDGRTDEKNKLVYWLNHMKNYGGDSKAIILVNQKDQHRVDIPINSLKELYQIAGLYTFSIKNDIAKLDDFKKVVAELIKDNPSWNKLEIPANYYRVKEELENLFIKGVEYNCKEHISKKKFIEIARNNGVKKIDELLSSLNALGVCLWYKDMEAFDTLVLNPEWISYGVYKIINWVNEEKRYSLTLPDFEIVFKEDNDRYSVNTYNFLFELMKHYELAYETDHEKCLIIPHLLKEDRPLKLPDFPLGESLMLRYKAEQPLPPNTISRFIVRHNQEIKKGEKEYLVWRCGVVLEYEKRCLALIREDDRTISVSVKGQGKTDYLSVLRETLNDIFKSYKSEKPDLQYRIERYGQIPDDLELRNPLWLQDRKILIQAKDNIPYYDENTRQLIDLQYTINKYNINNQTLISGNGNQVIDKSSNNTFNFYNCNINLQGSLNELARLLAKTGNDEVINEIKYATEVLGKVEKSKNAEEVKKAGVIHSLKRLVDELVDDGSQSLTKSRFPGKSLPRNKDGGSRLHKMVIGIKGGINIIQDIAKAYNEIAQWIGLPLVPIPLLNLIDNEKTIFQRIFSHFSKLFK